MVDRGLSCPATGKAYHVWFAAVGETTFTVSTTVGRRVPGEIRPVPWSEIGTW